MDVAAPIPSATAIGKSGALPATSDASQSIDIPIPSLMTRAFCDAALFCHNYRGVVANTTIEVGDVLVVHADAAVGHEAADR
jgi:hypothetical protein